MSLHLQALYQALQPTTGSPRDESARLADRRTASLYFMKTHSQLLVSAICMAALLFTGAALAQTPSPSVAPLMKAIVYRDYGSPDVLRLEEIEKPVPNDHQVLASLTAPSVHPLHSHSI